MSKDTTLTHKYLVEKLRSFAASAEKEATAARAYLIAADLLQTCNDIFGVPTTEEEDEKIRQKEYELGQAVALERVGAQLLAAGCDCFGNDKDEKAKWFRELSSGYKKEASVIRAKLKKIYDFP